MGVVSLVLEILLLSKTAKFPFLTMDYSPWSPKNLIIQNWLEKFMQVCVDVSCMYTNFGGCDLSGFRDIATIKNGQISRTIAHGGQKVELVQKSLQFEVDNLCICTKFGGPLNVH